MKRAITSAIYKIFEMLFLPWKAKNISFIQMKNVLECPFTIDGEISLLSNLIFAHSVIFASLEKISCSYVLNTAFDYFFYFFLVVLIKAYFYLR